MKLLPATFFFCAALAVHVSARGQSSGAGFDQSGAVAIANENPRPFAAAAPASTARVRGTVKCPEGLLPGAVVHLNGTRTYVATNATGDFELAVPESVTSVEVTCSFAGFRDAVQRLSVKAAPATILLDKLTELPPPDRSAETGWW